MKHRVLIPLFASAILLNFSFLQSAFSAPEAGNVVFVKGSASLKNTKTSKKEVLKPGQKISQGAVITTGKSSMVKLIFKNQTISRIGENSVININSLKEGQPAVVSLEKGQARISVLKDPMGKSGGKKRKHKFFLKTKTATMGVRGTDFLASYNPNRDQSSCVTFEGEVVMAKAEAAGGQTNLAALVEKLSGNEASVVNEGQFSLATANSKFATIATKISPAQFATMQDNVDFSSAPGAGQTGDSSKFKSPIPPGLDTRAMMGSGAGIDGVLSASGGMSRADMDIASIQAQGSTLNGPPPEGFVDQDTGRFAPPAGGFFDPMVGYIPPPPGSPFDPITNTFIPPPDYGTIGANGGWVPPSDFFRTDDGDVKFIGGQREFDQGGGPEGARPGNGPDGKPVVGPDGEQLEEGDRPPKDMCDFRCRMLGGHSEKGGDDDEPPPPPPWWVGPESENKGGCGPTDPMCMGGTDRPEDTEGGCQPGDPRCASIIQKGEGCAPDDPTCLPPPPPEGGCQPGDPNCVDFQDYGHGGCDPGLEICDEFHAGCPPDDPGCVPLGPPIEFCNEHPNDPACTGDKGPADGAQTRIKINISVGS